MSAMPSKAAVRIRYIAIALLLLMPVAALGTRFGLWHFKIGLLLLVVAMLGGVLIQIINAIWLLRKPATETKTVLRWSSLIALPPLVLFAIVLRSSGSHPAIHNISTDTLSPPQFVAGVEQRGSDSNPLAYSEELATIQREAYPHIQTLQSPLAPEAAFERAIAVAEAMGWEIYAQDPQQGRIEAVDTTLWFGFKDDVVIRINAADKQGSLIDLRSVSRVGLGDAGTNAKRIEDFLQQFQQQ